MLVALYEYSHVFMGVNSLANSVKWMNGFYFWENMLTIELETGSALQPPALPTPGGNLRVTLFASESNLIAMIF